MRTLKVTITDDDADWINSLADRMDVRTGVLLRYLLTGMSSQIRRSTCGRRDGRVGVHEPSPPGALISAAGALMGSRERASDAVELMDALQDFQRALYDRTEDKQPDRRPGPASGSEERWSDEAAGGGSDAAGSPPSCNTGGSSPGGSQVRPIRLAVAR